MNDCDVMTDEISPESSSHRKAVLFRFMCVALMCEDGIHCVRLCKNVQSELRCTIF